MVAIKSNKIYRSGYTMELLPDNTLYLNFDGTKYIDEVEVIKIKL